MSTMKFCRECNNILYPKEDVAEKRLLFACRNCDHQEIADNNCVYRNVIHHAAAEHTQVLQDVAADPTLPRTKSIRCAQCNHPEAVFFQWILLGWIVIFCHFKAIFSKFHEIEVFNRKWIVI